MEKLLITSVCCASLALTACSSVIKQEETIVYHKSILEDLPFVYKINVQQGNIVTQEAVNQLQPGMNKRQVRFLLGTPMLVDVFHQDRWDYINTQREGREPMIEKRLTLFFEKDSLARIEGDIKPEPNAEPKGRGKETVVEVPDYEAKEGIVARTLKSVGLEAAEN